MVETWKDLPGFEGSYQVSVTGHIKSSVHRAERILKATTSARGYLMLAIHGKTVTVHSLVMLAFVGVRPEGMHINHKDGNKTNNHLSNLEYVSPLENAQHAIKNGLTCAGIRHFHSKLNEEQVRAIRIAFSAGMTLTQLAPIYNVSKGAIHCVVNRLSWKHIE